MLWTTAHPLQVVGAPVPMLAHDIAVDLIVTPGARAGGRAARRGGASSPVDVDIHLPSR